MSRKNSYKSSKFLVNLFLLIVILITLVSVGLFFNAYKPSPASTLNSADNWKTYIDLKGKFSFKYRPDLTIKEINSNTINIGKQNPLSEKINYEDQFYGFFETIDNPSGLTPKQYATTKICFQAKKLETVEWCNSIVVKSLENYSNGIINGIKFDYNLYENPTHAILFSIDKKLFMLRATGQTGSSPTKLGYKTIDQILSTFKFLK